MTLLNILLINKVIKIYRSTLNILLNYMKCCTNLIYKVTFSLAHFNGIIKFVSSFLGCSFSFFTSKDYASRDKRYAKLYSLGTHASLFFFTILFFLSY